MKRTPQTRELQEYVHFPKKISLCVGDHYILHGIKAFITNGGLAGFYIVFATTDPRKRDGGLNAFIVDGDAKGLRLGAIEETMGLRASQTGELIFDHVEVPVENLFGVENT